MVTRRTWYNQPPEPLYTVKRGLMTLCRSTEEEVMFDIMMTDAQVKLGYEDNTPLTRADVLHFIDTFGVTDKGNKTKIIKTSYSEIAQRRGYEVKAIKNLLRDLHERGEIKVVEYKTNPDKIKLILVKKRKYTKRKEE